MSKRNIVAMQLLSDNVASAHGSELYMMQRSK